MSFYTSLVVKKQQVLDFIEPYVQTETIGTDSEENAFTMCKLGSFEFDCEEYIFGTEEHQYMSTMRSNRAKEFPVVVAKVISSFGKTDRYKMVPLGNFANEDVDLIQRNIDYTFESQRVMSKYFSSHC